MEYLGVDTIGKKNHEEVYTYVNIYIYIYIYVCVCV